MTDSTQNIPAESISELKRGRFIHALVNRDTTPLVILIMAGVVGIVTGLLGVAFDRGVDWITQQRLATLAKVADNAILVWPLAFIMSALLAMVGYFLVRRFAPEAGGSGIPEIEGAMEEMRPVRWWRVIPVKFIGGLGTLGAGMVLGREGPMVQMGGNSGRMIVDIFRLRSPEARHSLLATGAAAGLSAAFNAPLAGILFVIEEMRSQFRYSLVSIKAVFVGVITSTIVYRYFNGERAIIDVGKLSDVSLDTLWLFLLLGIIFGVVGVVFNALIFRTQDMFMRFHGGDWRKLVLVGGLLGGMCGLLALIHGEAVGGGFALIPIAVAGNFSIGMLLLIFIARVITTLLCFGSGAPGGYLPLCWLWGPFWGLPLVYLALTFSRNTVLMQVLLQ